MKDKPTAGIGRRAFIQVSSTVASGVLLLGPGMLAGELAAAPKRLAVGFVDWPWDGIDRDKPLDVIPAQSLHYGSDATFLRHDARISVVSSGSASVDPKTRRAVELTAHFAYFEGSERRVAPFHAWTYDRTTGDAGNPIRFNVPLDDQQAIRLSVGTEISQQKVRRRPVGGPALSGSLPFVLSLRDEPGSYRLVPGYYVLVPLSDGEGETAWSSYALRFSNGRWRLHGRNGELASIEHLVLRVGYAT